MLATRQSLRSVRLSCRRPLLPVPRPQLRLPHALRTFAAAPRAAQRLEGQTDEEYVKTVREEWGDNLPEGLLTQSEFVVYQRYYGQPARMLKEGENPFDELDGVKAEEEEEEEAPGTVTLQDKDGVGIEMFEEEVVEMDSVAVDVNGPLEAKAYAQLQRDMERTFQDSEHNEEFEAEQEEEEEEGEGEEDDLAFRDDGSHTMRTHPLTSVGRFATLPATIKVPPSVQLPTLESLSDVPNKHLDKAAYNLLGGPKLPDSPVFTNRGGKTLRDIWLSAEDSRMSDISSEVFLATIMPGYYAQSLSALTELRRRLGGDWVLGRDGEGGVKNILDVGSGGAGVLAWKNIMEAEHTRRRDEAREAAGEPAADDDDDDVAAMAAEATAGLKASVVTASDSLRHRISKFLDNTTFLPRMPDRNPDNVFHVPGHPRVSLTPNPKQPRKVYDLIIATNNLLPIRETHARKDRLRKLWSHLSPDGGVLVMIEKGTPHGFEAIASARSTLLRTHISSPGSETRPIGGNTGLAIDDEPIEKEPGAIIAPCTNHEECPMFVRGYATGVGRRDWCRFSQRYERPSYMQRVIGEDHRNHEDLLYSYVAVRRGVDHRRTDAAPIDPQIHEFALPERRGAPTLSPYSPAQLRRHAFSLPRAILPPMKRHGHVILDVCTPAGKIERWTVPKSFGKVPFRDARKSRWGDLWALGAKTMVPRNIKIGGDGKKSKRVVREIDENGEQKVRIQFGRREEKHWSRGRNKLGEMVERKKQLRRNIRWASQRKDMEGDKGEFY